MKTDPEQYLVHEGVKILGRVRSIHRNPTQVIVKYDMQSYVKGIVNFYCEITDTNPDKLKKGDLAMFA